MDASILYREIGGMICRRRRALDLTQAKLAAKLGMSRGALANIETGRQNLLLHQLYRFAAALEMNIHDLLPAFKDELDLAPSKTLPLPKDLSPEQKLQVSRVFSNSLDRRNTKGE